MQLNSFFQFLCLTQLFYKVSLKFIFAYLFNIGISYFFWWPSGDFVSLLGKGSEFVTLFYPLYMSRVLFLRV